MNLVLIGPPGAGKGTQSDFLVKKFKLEQISTGNLLREQIKNKKILGNKIEDIINVGKFVSDEIVNSLLEKIISDPSKTNKLIFDGYPRNLTQAKNLDFMLSKYSQKISAVLFLDVDRDAVKKRIEGRLFCLKCQKTFNKYFNPSNQDDHKCDDKFMQKRNDDNLNTIINRFDTFVKSTKPVLEYYKNKLDYYNIDGTKNISDISREIDTILSNIKN